MSESVMSSSVRGITESTEAEGRDDTHHTSLEPRRTSPRPFRRQNLVATEHIFNPGRNVYGNRLGLRGQPPDRSPVPNLREREP